MIALARSVGDRLWINLGPIVNDNLAAALWRDGPRFVSAGVAQLAAAETLGLVRQWIVDFLVE